MAPPAAPRAAARPPVPQGGKGVFNPGGGDGLANAPTKPKKSASSAKRADETGMLQMQALKDVDDDEEQTGAAPSSATQFFAIPAAKKKAPSDGGGGALPPPRAENTAGRALPGAPSPAMQIGMAPPGGGMQPHQPGQFPGMIGGPIAAGPVAGGNTPFAVGGPVPAGGVPPEENRAQSFRVFAIVLALCGMALFVMILAVVAIMVGANMTTDKPEVVAEAPKEKSERPAKKQDTGDEKPLVIDTPKPKPSGTPKPKPVVVAAPVVAAPALGDVTVKVGAGDTFTGIEISECGSIRARATFSGGVAVLKDIPTDGTCKINFKGGAPASYRPVKGGTTWTCTFRDSTAACNPG